nr:hypothetical protein [uncultured bacterium]
MKTMPLSTKVSRSHTATACNRTDGDIYVGLARLMYILQAITAITPEVCSPSAARYTAYGTKMLIAISIGPSSIQRSRTETTAPKTSPMRMPPLVRKNRRPTPSITVGVLPLRRSIIPNCRARRPVPSFTKLSASRSDVANLHDAR